MALLLGTHLLSKVSDTFYKPEQFENPATRDCRSQGNNALMGPDTSDDENEEERGGEEEVGGSIQEIEDEESPRSNDEHVDAIGALRDSRLDANGSEKSRNGSNRKLPGSYKDTAPSENDSKRSPLSTSAVSSHLDYKRDVFLNFEVLRGGQHKMAQGIWLFHLAAAIACYGVSQHFYQYEREVVRATTERNEKRLEKLLHGGILHILRGQVQLKLYVSLAAYCFFIALCMGIWCIVRLVKTRNFQWTRRQRYLVTVVFLKLFVQIMNLLFWVAPNAYALASSCRWYSHFADASAFIRYTCLNTVMSLAIIHSRNCGPALQKVGKHKDQLARVGDKRLKYNGNDPMILDRAAFAQHWPVLILWSLLEAVLIYLAASGFYTYRFINIPSIFTMQPAPKFCAPKITEFPRLVSIKMTVVFCLIPAFLTFQICCASVIARISTIKLRGQPYTVYQFANLLVMWLRRQSIWMDAIAIADVSLLYADGTLIAYFNRWYGLPGVQLMFTATAILDAFYLLPMEPSNEEHVYNSWLQQFVWVDKEVKPRMRGILKQSPTIGRAIGSHPIFCMESAFKMLVWSTVVYEDATADEEMPPLKGHSTVNPETLGNGQVHEHQNGDVEVKNDQKLSASEIENNKLGNDHNKQANGTDLEGSDGELERESILASVQDASQFQQAKSDEQEETSSSLDKKHDTEGKDGDKAASAIRAELTTKQYLGMAMNMYELTDMKVIHGPLTDTKAIIAWNNNRVVLAFRGTSSMANVKSDMKIMRDYHEPKRGRYWLGKAPLVHRGFQTAWKEVKERVMEQMATIVETVHCPASLLRVYITGHSLGGALGTLAAYDIQSKYHFSELLCYTFGAPRTGNQALADELSRLVPNMYHVINDRDAVPANGKFGVLYKRAGQRVLINARGDIRVRPTIFEMNLHSGGFSVKMHLLKAYLDSLASICVSQFFKTKAIAKGLKGVRRLARSEEICLLLKSIGIDLKVLLKTPEMDITHVIRSTSAKGGKKVCKKFQNNLTALARELIVVPFEGE